MVRVCPPDGTVLEMHVVLRRLPHQYAIKHAMSAGLPVCRLESPPVLTLLHAQPVQQILPYLSHHHVLYCTSS